MQEILAEINKKLDEIKELVAKIDVPPKKSLEVAPQENYKLSTFSMVFDDPFVQGMSSVTYTEANLTEFDKLKQLLHSDSWPTAIEPSLICNLASEQDKEDRAEGIVDLLIDVSLRGIKFLDFGCGEGHIAKKALEQEPKAVVGYDIQENENWNKWDYPNLSFTTNWDKVKENGPYDVILLYDVLDHISGSDDEIIDQFKSIKEVMHENSILYTRFHPFCSRHATHLYHQINKAYIHLVFSDEEIISMGYKPLPTKKTIHPIGTYNKIINKSGFKLVKKEQSYRETLEPFFKENELVANRIKKNWANSHDVGLRTGRAFPLFQLELQFIDYCLKL